MAKKSSHHQGNGHGRQHVTETPDVSYITNPDVAHEHSDVSVGPILQFVVGLFIFCVVVAGLMLLMFNYFETRERQREFRERPPSPITRTEAERLPPGPRLQAAPGFEVQLPDGQRRNLSLQHPQAEWDVVREMWERRLHSYEWVDEQNGVVSIPVDRAMEMLLQRGLPVGPAQPQGATPQRAQGELIPSMSSSGRQNIRRDR